MCMYECRSLDTGYAQMLSNVVTIWQGWQKQLKRVGLLTWRLRSDRPFGAQHKIFFFTFAVDTHREGH